jgi:hypothetical protein
MMRKICKKGLTSKGNYIIITLFSEPCLKPRIVPPYVTLITAMLALRTLVRGLFFSTFFLGGFIRLLPIFFLLARGLPTRLTMNMISVEVLTYEIHKILILSPQPFLFLASFCNQFSQVPLIVTPIVIYLKVVKNRSERQHNVVDNVRLR